MGLDDFVEMTKKYARGIAPSPVMAAAGGDDDYDDVVVKNPDELPLHQKVGCWSALFPHLFPFFYTLVKQLKFHLGDIPNFTMVIY